MNTLNALKLDVLTMHTDAAAVVEALKPRVWVRTPDVTTYDDSSTQHSYAELQSALAERFRPHSLKWCHPEPRYSASFKRWRGEWHTYISYTEDPARARRGDSAHVYLVDPRARLDTREVVQLLQDAPFLFASGNKLEGEPWDSYNRGMERAMSGPGWLMVYKGEGHRRLASRRWLTHGPWRLIRDEARDLTAIQFHDLDESVSLAEMFEQAKPGLWEMFGAPNSLHFTPELDHRGFQPGLYDKRSNTSIVVVPDEEEVSPEHMTIAAWFKREQPVPDLQIDQVAFVYFNETIARRQLPLLWRMGLEVRLQTPAGQRRLDDQYEPPPPVVPDWVKRVQDREGF